MVPAFLFHSTHAALLLPRGLGLGFPGLLLVLVLAVAIAVPVTITIAVPVSVAIAVFSVAVADLVQRHAQQLNARVVQLLLGLLRLLAGGHAALYDEDRAVALLGDQHPVDHSVHRRRVHDHIVIQFPHSLDQRREQLAGEQLAGVGSRRAGEDHVQAGLVGLPDRPLQPKLTAQVFGKALAQLYAVATGGLAVSDVAVQVQGLSAQRSEALRQPECHRGLALVLQRAGDAHRSDVIAAQLDVAAQRVDRLVDLERHVRNVQLYLPPRRSLCLRISLSVHSRVSSRSLFLVEGHRRKHRQPQIFRHVVVVLDGVVQHHLHGDERRHQQNAHKPADQHELDEARRNVFHSLGLGVVDDRGLARADDLIDLLDGHVQQVVGDVPAGLYIGGLDAGADDVRPRGIGDGDQLAQLLVVGVQLEIVNDLVQHRPTGDDRPIVLGQRGADLQILEGDDGIRVRDVQLRRGLIGVLHEHAVVARQQDHPHDKGEAQQLPVVQQYVKQLHEVDFAAVSLLWISHRHRVSRRSVLFHPYFLSRGD